MKQISQIIKVTSTEDIFEHNRKNGYVFRNKRDQLIKEAVEHINKLREGTKYRKETPANLAKRVNMNKFLLDDSELEYVLKNCRAKNNYSHLYWLIK
jgi:thermostable 8-oxoguanine DNA glycosylase